jgi:hypothetical protein
VKGRTPALSARARDCLFLAGLVGLSVVLYTGGLGFYSDDWAFLRLLETTRDRSYAGLVRALYEGDVFIQQRPVQVAYLAGLYWLFGLEPLGYHIVNALVLVGVVVLFYLVLRELAQPRGLAVAAAAVYGLMPNYSSDRFWIAADQATLSMLFLLVGTLAAFHSLRAGRAAAIALSVASVAALTASGLAYEVTIPLIALVLGLLAYRARWLDLRRPSRRGWVLSLLGANVMALGAVVAFKIETSVRVGVDQPYGEYLADLVSGTLRVDLGVYGLALPYVLFWIAGHAADAAVLGLGACAVGAVTAYVVRVQRSEAEVTQTLGLRYIGAGLATMAIGYAVFVVPTVVSFSSASLGNRIRIAAALGTAALLVGAIALIASLVRRPAAARGVLAVGVGLMCGAGFVVTNTLARFWVSAYEEQQEIVQQLVAEVPRLLPGTAVILDGACFERGGAYVFTGHRDVRGVLTIRYRQPDVDGSAITKPPKIMPRGLSVHTFGAPDVFPYEKKLIVYNIAERRARRLVDRERARQYFEESGFSPQQDCLPGFAWRGDAPSSD